MGEQALHCFPFSPLIAYEEARVVALARFILLVWFHGQASSVLTHLLLLYACVLSSQMEPRVLVQKNRLSPH